MIKRRNPAMKFYGVLVTNDDTDTSNLIALCPSLDIALNEKINYLLEKYGEHYKMWTDLRSADINSFKNKMEYIENVHADESEKIIIKKISIRRFEISAWLTCMLKMKNITESVMNKVNEERADLKEEQEEKSESNE